MNVYILLGSQVGSTDGVYVLLIDGFEGGSTVGVHPLHEWCLGEPQGGVPNPLCPLVSSMRLTCHW